MKNLFAVLVLVALFATNASAFDAVSSANYSLQALPEYLAAIDRIEKRLADIPDSQRFERAYVSLQLSTQLDLAQFAKKSLEFDRDEFRIYHQWYQGKPLTAETLEAIDRMLNDRRAETLESKAGKLKKMAEQEWDRYYK